MSDIEFLVQGFQLRYGWKHPGLRNTSTVMLLRTLGSLNLISPLIASRLSEAYLHFMRVRNQKSLRGDNTITSPEDSETYSLMQEVRTIFDREFYGLR